MASVDVFRAIADDLGIMRVPGERDADYCCRVAYSAARFWASAFCMDDGCEGRKGLTRPALSRKMRQWVETLISLAPDIEDWFEIDARKGSAAGSSLICGRLIDLADILPAGEEGRLLARSPKLEVLTDKMALLLGFFDPGVGVPGLACENLVTSGLCTMICGDYDAPEILRPWWETDLSYMPWVEISALPDLEYADPATRKWGIGSAEAWRESPVVDVSLALARDKEAARNGGSGMGPVSYYVIKIRGRRCVASQISWSWAQELFLKMKWDAGSPACVEFEKRGANHEAAFLPVSILPPRASVVIDALSWPLGSISDGANSGEANRLIRTEAMDAVASILSQHFIKTKGFHDDR